MEFITKNWPVILFGAWVVSVVLKKLLAAGILKRSASLDFAVAALDALATTDVGAPSGKFPTSSAGVKAAAAHIAPLVLGATPPAIQQAAALALAHAATSGLNLDDEKARRKVAKFISKHF